MEPDAEAQVLCEFCAIFLTSGQYLVSDKFDNKKRVLCNVLPIPFFMADKVICSVLFGAFNNDNDTLSSGGTQTLCFEQ